MEVNDLFRIIGQKQVIIEAQNEQIKKLIQDNRRQAEHIQQLEESAWESNRVEDKELSPEELGQKYGEPT